MSVKTHNKTKLVPVNRSVALLPERDASISPILECIDLGVTFGGLKAVDNFDITIGRTEIAGLIGPNGAGKTTIFNLLTKVYQPTHGTILLDGKDIHGMTTAQVNRAGIARTFQNIRLFKKMTVIENVKAAMLEELTYNMPQAIFRTKAYWQQEAAATARAKELLQVVHLSGKENLEALEKGLPNLLQHVSNITTVYKLPCVVAINRFPTDTEAELKLIETKCKELGVNVALSEVWGKGGEGGVELAKEVIRLCEQPNDFTFSYELNCSIKEKIEAIAKKIYHADGVNFTANAEKQIKTLTELGYDHMPICMAKTQYSFTDDQTKLGAPRDFTITVRNVKVSAGAGFLVALTGEIMTMPGLPKVPAAERIDVDETGKISGLF